MPLRNHPVYLIILASVLLSSCRNPDRPKGDSEPQDPMEINTRLWNDVPKGLNGGFGSVDTRYSRSIPPVEGITGSIEKTGWRGEKLSFQAIYWSKTPAGLTRIIPGDLTGEKGNIDAAKIEIRTVKYLLADEFLDGCGYRDKDTIASHLSPDLLENKGEFSLPGYQSRPVWITVDIPEDANPGIYKADITAFSESDTLVTSIILNVQDMLLPSPDRWSFHLDLWQNPWAVARYHDVEPWSQEHLDLLKPLLEMLASAGQKCITTTINDHPWGGQTFDPYGSMITWLRNSDGTWDYDYSVFDIYVNLAMDCGIKSSINCYSMVPWGNRITWYDQDSARFLSSTVMPGSEEYEQLWRPFLFDFRAHLMESGWLDITSLALDERSAEEMSHMFSFLQKTVPEFKISMAGNYFDDINGFIDDYSFNWRELSNRSSTIAAERRARSQVTTYYVACGIPKPNNFTFSPPAESCYEGWFAAAMGLDGFLRWAYNSWPEDPVNDSRFISWPSGDTYFVYPEARSSIRFERLVEGIQDYEKIRILKNKLAGDSSVEAARSEKLLKDFLDSINIQSLENRQAEAIVNEGKKLVDSITSAITR